MTDYTDLVRQLRERIGDPGAWLAADAIERLQADVELGGRAARLVTEMLPLAMHNLTTEIGEINEVLIEARKRGWL